MSVQAPPPPKGGKHFTPFYSVTEEAMTNAEGKASDNEGGHMSSTSGRRVGTPDADLRYKGVLSQHGRADAGPGFATMREAEAFIRRNTPVPAARSTLRDQDASEAPAIHAPNDGIAQ